ncbi:hypothetical protein QE373_003158 [Stenotrophomonas sp. SORGH_AS321]|nr:hypothetical protein [Stenotrophomonas sp. SORGH_AS_0321]
MALIEPHYPIAGRRGRQPYPLATMLRVPLLQQWYALSDPTMEEALYDTAVMRRFAGINSLERIPDETTVLDFRRSLETHGLGAKMLEAFNAHLHHQGLSLRSSMIVDATIIHTPSSTQRANKARDPEMHPTRKGSQWCDPSYGRLTPLVWMIRPLSGRQARPMHRIRRCILRDRCGHSA